MKVSLISAESYVHHTSDARFLQSAFWAEFKSHHGWKPLFFEIHNTEFHKTDDLKEGDYIPQSCWYMSVLVRHFSRYASLCYIPAAPETADSLSDIAYAIKQFLPKNCLCLRFDPPKDFSAFYIEIPFHRTGLDCGFMPPLRKSLSDIQPPDTVILDLCDDESQLLEKMKSKWRYNIKLAEKKGVTVRCALHSDIDIFYKLYIETAKRDGIAVHSRAYYADLLALSESTGKSSGIEIRLYIAEHEGDALAAIITLHSARESVYLYGASSNQKRNLMATYVLQWKAICDSKAFGSKSYDLYGIPPDDNEHHPMHGLYRFKTGFGGKIVHRAGSIDMPLLPIRYALYRQMEQLRAFWYKKVKKFDIRLLLRQCKIGRTSKQ